MKKRDIYGFGFSIEKPQINKLEKFSFTNIDCIAMLNMHEGSIKKITARTHLRDCDPSLWKFLNISSSQANSKDKYGKDILIGMFGFELWAVMPGSVAPFSGPITCTMPWRFAC